MVYRYYFRYGTVMAMYFTFHSLSRKILNIDTKENLEVN